MLPQEIVRAKRDGQLLDAATIQDFVRGITDGSVSEAQAAAFAMAVFFRGMSLDERVALTRAMRDSGTVMEWRSLNLPGPVIDKHSTGGVGDKVSLILAPMLAACGGFVPMVSGRGLGHTGGTLDKFESIPGYRAKPDNDLLRRVVKQVGCAVIGATDDIAPADKRLYAIRDVTATVESLDLITASILSKKLAAGLDALVMDVKFGSGAFMQRLQDAEALAESIVTVSKGAGLPAVALLTDMNEVLGRSAGNALEMRECLAILRGEPAEPRLYEVTAALAAELLALAGLAPDAAAGRAMADRSIASGAAAERFARMVEALGGPADLLEQPDRHLERAPIVRPVFAERAGFVGAIDTRGVGMAVVALGGGRTRTTDAIDFAVGFDEVAGLGDAVGPTERPLAILHARTEAQADEAERRLRASVTVRDAAPERGPLIAKRLG
ncbi:thymidine phosphorylase [Azospirillum sp. TSH7]|uniref:thymidine phosphorylase n=1 Tax=unclassified Azospirillum TaxID=2630922 RepID=UPI000D618857|nr:MULTISPECIES: thymidine phosphorylase [unclassified Azospirillum]PWC66100.1 thymidine phosphorylase [Azospirillum sp. TSH7]PWC72419.1 thymidine phosphorylase [Azospirillum sp. TSH20]